MLPQRLAAAMSIMAFAFCLLVGGFGADNALSTVIYRALVAMAGTFVVAFVVGIMASKMIEENVAASVHPADPAQSAQKFSENSERIPKEQTDK